jgi:hypothetical protein
MLALGIVHIDDRDIGGRHVVAAVEVDAGPLQG